MNIPQELLPLDKSWMMRMGILDIIHKSSRTVEFLRQEPDLNDDLIALMKASEAWYTSKEIFVGESGTLYRFLLYTAWKQGVDKLYIKTSTLVNRSINHNADVVDWKQSKLLTLDNNTSQWASAAALNGDLERISNAPFKLQVTYDAIAHYKQTNGTWSARSDETIATQAESFVAYLQTGNLSFVPEQAEDFCFARAFNLISTAEGEARWPNLRGHESDRIEMMEVELQRYEQGEAIESADHRVVQAIALRSFVDQKKTNFLNPKAVNKTWPRFWAFLDWCTKEVMQNGQQVPTNTH